MGYQGLEYWSLSILSWFSDNCR